MAQYEDEESFLAASGDRLVFAFDDVMAQSQCWNCRGLGHVRTACPSADGTRAVGHVVCALQSSASYRGPASKGKGKGKGKGAGRGSGGRGRSAAGRGKGAVAACLEDNQAWGLDGAFITTVNADALGYDEHEDEEAHTALMTRTAGAGSSSDDDGDAVGWTSWVTTPHFWPTPETLRPLHFRLASTEIALTLGPLTTRALQTRGRLRIGPGLGLGA